MDEKTKQEVLKNIERLKTATTSAEVKKIEQETILIIRKSSEFSEKPAEKKE